MRKRMSASALLLGGLLGVAGCVNPNAGLPPGSTRVEAPAPPAASAVREAPAPAPAPAARQVAAAPAAAQGGDSFVVRKVRQLGGEADALAKVIEGLEKTHATLRAGARQRAEGYHGRVAAIEARLKIGTTRANPRLRAQWNVAQSLLAALDRDVGAWDVLRTRAAEADSRAAFLNDSVLNAFELSGAVEEDHRALHTIGDRAAHMSVTVTRLLDEVAAASERQSRLVTAERRELALLAEAIDAGSLEDGVVSGPYSSRAAEDRPLAVVRFDDPGVAFEEALSAAVQQVLDRRPGTTFEVVGVSPGGSMAAAADYADKVHRSLRRMGVAASRLRIATRADSDVNVEEVRLYVR